MNVSTGNFHTGSERNNLESGGRGGRSCRLPSPCKRVKGVSVENLIDQVWVELVGNIIIARISGEASPEMLKARHERILQIEQDTGCKKLLLDDLQMAPLAYSGVEAQRVLSRELETLGFKIAILVPNSKMAFIARQKFSGDNARVFYNNMVEALAWLAQ